MLVLAIDTSAAQCAACVFDTDAGRELGREVLDLGKGHAEHLMAVIEAALERAGISYDALDRIAVAVGPGSFTGVRVGVSTARGLALALKIPAIGISTLEAVAAQARAQGGAANVLVAFETIENRLQAALFDEDGTAIVQPAIIDMEQALNLVAQYRPVIAGTAAARIIAESGTGQATAGEQASADITFYAQLAATKGDDEEKPKPLYLREPDAKPQAGFVLPRA